eukprot:9388694-Lingulodinium_polyedra.AAC.1
MSKSRKLSYSRKAVDARARQSIALAEAIETVKEELALLRGRMEQEEPPRPPLMLQACALTSKDVASLDEAFHAPMQPGTLAAKRKEALQSPLPIPQHR